MNLRHMEVFHAVYVNGTVIGAARALNVSQPSISKVLAHAESRLGFPLFQRLRGRLTPTDEAHILFREIDELQGRLGAVHRTAKNLKGGIGSYLRLSVLPSLGLDAVPMAVTRLLKARPKLSVDVQTLHHDDFQRSLIERESDLTIGFDALAHPRLDGRRIGEGELVVFFRKSAIPAPPDRIRLTDLARHRLISVVNSGPIGNLFANQTLASELVFDEQISVRTFFVAAGMVKAGAGVAVIDEFTARASQTEALDFRPLDPPMVFGVHATFLVDRPPSRPANEFVAAVAEILAAPEP